jgi:archaellum component FlaC
MDVEKAMKSLNQIREKIEKLKSDKIRLTANLETHENNLDELEEKCKEDFGVDTEGLGDKIDELNEEVEKSLSEIEELLEK